jgi:hypothetical protein
MKSLDDGCMSTVICYAWWNSCGIDKMSEENKAAYFVVCQIKDAVASNEISLYICVCLCFFLHLQIRLDVMRINTICKNLFLYS